MEQKLIGILRWALPLAITAYFPYRFYADIAHYRAHGGSPWVFFLGMIGFLICLALIVSAVKRRSWFNLALCCIALFSCVFFSYWEMQIPFCQECEPLTRDDLGFMLRPYAETFGIYH